MKSYFYYQPGTVQRDVGYPSPVLTTYDNSVFKWAKGRTVIVDTTTGNFVTPNPCSFRTFDQTSISGYFHQESRNFYTHISGDYLSPGSYDVPVVDMADDMYNRALENLNEQIRGSLDLSVDFAEAGKTAHMVKNALNVVRLAHDLKANAGKFIAGNWLAYQYGWRPLYLSIYGSFDELMNKSLARQLTLRFVGRSYGRLDNKSPFSYAARNIGMNKNATRYRGEIGVIVKNGSLSPSAANYTSLNPLSIMWELLPYSFVVDWFLDIGGYLRNAETAMIYGRSFDRGWYTYGYKSSQVITIQGTDLGGGYYNLEGTSRLAFKARNRLTAYPFPRMPVFNRFDLGSTRLLNAAALLSQIMDRPIAKTGPVIFPDWWKLKKG